MGQEQDSFRIIQNDKFEDQIVECEKFKSQESMKKQCEDLGRI